MAKAGRKHVTSPEWGATTKLVIALTFVAIAAGFFVRFQSILAPLMVAFVLSYLFHPIAIVIQRLTRLSWGVSVGLIYLILLLFVLGLIALGGVGLIQQVQSVVKIVDDGLNTLPGLMAQISGRVYQFGPFYFDFRTLDLRDLSTQALAMVQPLIGRTGTLLGSLATGAASFLGWTLFVLLVSYFALSESGGLRGNIVSLDIPGYSEDIARLSRELGQVWNAFLRGQIIIFILTVITYTVLLTVLGIHYAIGLAFLAGFARFVPYIGPAINWTTLVLVAYFQQYKLFDLSPLTYALIVLGLAWLVDQVFDTIISPRILSHALKVHPAGVLVAAIIFASLLGVLGIVIAAPMLATALLLWRYTMRKMLDLDPWPEGEARPPPPPASRMMVRIRRLWRALERRTARTKRSKS